MARRYREVTESPRGPDGEDTVVPLPHDAPPPTARPTGPGRLHGLAIAGIAVSALTGIASTLAFVTIRWPGSSGRYLIAVLFTSVIVFIVSASTAVLTAARDTYVRRGSNTDSD
jgi:hypothetical protein